MKFNPAFALLLLAALTACGLLPVGAPSSSSPFPAAGMPVIVTPTPPPPTATPVVILPSDTPTRAPISPVVVPRPQILSFQMTDPLNGWAIGEGQLLRTGDGGLTWYDVSPAAAAQTALNVTGRFFLNADVAWALVPGADNAQGILYHTADGGLTWRSASVPFGSGRLHFLNGQRGVCLTSLGAAAGSEAVALYQTSDGGSTWTRVYTNAPDDPAASGSLPFSGQKSGVAFLDAARGWIGGSMPAQGNTYLYATQDGGVTWTQQPLALPAGFETAMTEVHPPAFFTPFDGVLPVRLLTEPPSFVFYVTRDGGATWTATFPLNMDARYSMANLLDLFLWDGGPWLYVSRNTGLTWDRVATNVSLTETLAQFQFADARTGWALTRAADGHAALYKTVDGGATWSAIIP